MISMLQHLVDKNYPFPITGYMVAETAPFMRLRTSWKNITDAKSNVEKHIFYNDLTEEDKQEGILEGHLDLNPAAFIYGPTRHEILFMRTITFYPKTVRGSYCTRRGQGVNPV